MSYETWYFIHLLAYAGFVISFGHEIVWGELFADDAFSRWLWIALHVGVGIMLIRGRWGRLIAGALRPLHIAETRKLNDNTTELRLAGGSLHKMVGDAGQFVIVRPLAKGLWWQAHPFSLSSAPTTNGLKISVKSLGDGSTAIGRLPRGTRMIVEGPFGAFTPRAIDDRKVLFIVGGIGVAPVKAMLERLDSRHQPIVLVPRQPSRRPGLCQRVGTHGPGPRWRTHDARRAYRDARRQGSVVGQGVDERPFPT